MKLSSLAFVATFFTSVGIAQGQNPVPAQSASNEPNIAEAAKQPPATPKKWKCKADNLANASYSGGKYAFIHLSSYSSGGSYAATVNGDVATGTTKDGTPFECKFE